MRPPSNPVNPLQFCLQVHQKLENNGFTALDLKVAETAMHAVTLTDTDAKSWIGLAFAMCHRALRKGDTFLDISEQPKELQLLGIDWPALEEWQHWLENCSLENQNSSFLFELPSQLYLLKMWRYENSIAQQIARLAISNSDSAQKIALGNQIAEGCSEEQLHAIEACSRHNLILLSGGPGTGKTFTVLKCLASILTANPKAHIALTAPTGKAVARLQESIRTGLEHQTLDDTVKPLIPREASTLHRLLKGMEGSKRSHLIPIPKPQLDWLFIDEVSMVDIPLMHRILEILPPTCKIFMLGDINQLASVDPGSVFADLYNALRTIQSESHLKTIELTKVFRFEASPTLIALSQAVQAGQTETVESIVDTTISRKDFEWIDSNQTDATSFVESWLETHLLEASFTEVPEAAFQLFRKNMILSPVNFGTTGVQIINQQIQRKIEKEAEKQGASRYWCPIIILQNDYNHGLFNGDLGIQAFRPGSKTGGECYIDTSSGFRLFNSSQIPAKQPSYAISVHKSQGSEADDVLLILPPKSYPILTRELLYTAISRGKQRLSIVGQKERLLECVANKTSRRGHLRQRLQTTTKLALK